MPESSSKELEEEQDRWERLGNTSQDSGREKLFKRGNRENELELNFYQLCDQGKFLTPLDHFSISVFSSVKSIKNNYFTQGCCDD